MAKQQLNIEYDYDFFLLGLVCQAKDYRLCFEVNKKLGVEFNKIDTGKWISFPLTGLQLQKGMTYGFRLKSEKGLIGVGEAAGNFNQMPFIGGQEWAATSDNQSGNYYTYLSLAFKVELRA